MEQVSALLVIIFTYEILYVAPSCRLRPNFDPHIMICFLRCMVDTGVQEIGLRELEGVYLILVCGG